MTTWFQKTRRGSIEDIFLFKDNGKDPDKDTLSVKCRATAITSDDDYYYLCSYLTDTVSGYRIMNDKKGDEPNTFIGKPVVIAVQRKPVVTSTYKDKVTEITQPASHAYVATQLEALDVSQAYDFTTLSLNNGEDIHRALNDIGSSPEAAVTAKLYGQLLFKVALSDDADEELMKEFVKAQALAAAVTVPRAAGSYTKGNYTPKETHAEILAARRLFFVAELGGKDETILERLGAVGIERLEAIEVLIRLMDI